MSVLYSLQYNDKRKQVGIRWLLCQQIKNEFSFLFKMEQFANKNNTCYKENLISACYFTFFLIFLEKTKMLAFFY